MKNKQTGITLIALVITIILLLILAGITISTLGGQNGLFEKIKQAEIEQMKAEAKENITLAIMQIQIDDTQQGKETTLYTLQDKLSSTDARISVNEYNTEKIELKGIYTAEEKRFNYKIDKFFNVAIEHEEDDEVEDKIEDEVEEKLEIDENLQLWLDAGSIDLELEYLMSNEEILNNILDSEEGLEELLSDQNALYIIANNQEIRQEVLENNNANKKIQEKDINLDSYVLENYISPVNTEESINNILIASGKDSLTVYDVVNSEQLLNKIIDSKEAVDYMLTNETIMDCVVEKEMALQIINSKEYAKEQVAQNETMISKIQNSSNSSYAAIIQLPTGTQAIESVYSSSTTYFDTEYIPTLNTLIKTSIKFNSTTGSSHIGFYNYDEDADLRLFNLGTLYYDYLNTRNTWSLGDANIDSESFNEVEMGNMYLKVNGKVLLEKEKLTEGKFSQTGIKLGGEPYGKAECEFMYCQIYENNQLVRDYVPMEKDGETFLYDKITGQILYNKYD